MCLADICLKPCAFFSAQELNDETTWGLICSRFVCILDITCKQKWKLIYELAALSNMQNNKCCPFSMFALVNMQYQAFLSELIGTALITVACCYCVVACGIDIWHQSHSKAFLVSCLRYVCLFMSRTSLNEEKYSFSPVRPPSISQLSCYGTTESSPLPVRHHSPAPHRTCFICRCSFDKPFTVLLIYWHFLLISPSYLFAEQNVYLPLPLAPSMPWY